MRQALLVAGLLTLAVGPLAGLFGYLFTHPAELHQLVGEPERSCRCP